MKISTVSELRELYDLPRGRANTKLLYALEKHAKNFIDKSPFVVISTINKKGEMDTSPRGGEIGFVKVIDNKRIAIPDAKGNNRLDSLTNIIETESIGLLFLLPGVDETLRVNGTAYISTDHSMLDLFKEQAKPAKTCIVVEIKEVFLHCAKALMRSKLWDEKTKIKRSDFPSMGRMLKDQIGGDEKVESQEDMVKRYLPDL